MRIRLLSDLHTEFRLPYKTHPMLEYRGEDVLVLAGDIASGASNYIEVIKAFKRAGFPKIVCLPGNHEYYGTSIDAFDHKVQERLKGIPDIYYLNPGIVEISGVIFVGGCLWTNFCGDPLARQAAVIGINDFRRIYSFSADVCESLYREHLEWFKQAYVNRQGKKVVFVSHFLPAQECVSPRWQREGGILNKYFANDLGSEIETLQDSTWLFGHTHDATDITIGTTRLVANPHGYYKALNEGQDFDPFKTIEI
jgi:Icc-related predicted phosphoesterase